MAEKNSLWKNIRNKAKQNRKTGATPKKPTAEMLRQERKIKAQKADGGPVGDDGLYNMQRALELGYTPDETGHWPSVDSETGMWLKSKDHDTAWMEHLYGYALNPEVQKQYQHPVVNPEGYFGENQLQYNKKAQGGTMYPDGGKTTVYTDPREFRKAEKNYNDSLFLASNRITFPTQIHNAYLKNFDFPSQQRIYANTVIPVSGVEVNDEWTNTLNTRIKPTSFEPALYTSHSYPMTRAKYSYPKAKPILGKPTVDRLQSKQYTTFTEKPGIVGNVENISPSEINMDNFYEGQYEKYKRSPYEDSMYRVWVPGQQMQIVPEEQFKKLNDQYALKDLEQKAQGGRLYAKGGDDEDPVTLYKKAQYDPNTDRISEYAGSQGNEYYVTPNTPQGVDFERRLPEFEITDEYDSPKDSYGNKMNIASEEGAIRNPNYQPLASGKLDIDPAGQLLLAGAVANPSNLLGELASEVTMVDPTSLVKNVGKNAGKLVREQVYKAVDPVGYGVRDKILKAPQTWARNTFNPDKRLEVIGKEFNSFGIRPGDKEIRMAKNRLDSWRLGLGLDQKYDTFTNLGNNTYRINAMNPNEDVFNDLYSDILAHETSKRGYYFGDDPLINIANRNAVAKAKKSLSSQDLKNFFSSIEKGEYGNSPWQQTRIVENSKNPQFRHSIYDNDNTQAIMGNYRWDVNKLDDGTLHFQSNDTWDLNPWEKRGSINLSRTTPSPGYRKWNPFSNVEALSLVGGKPFKIQNNFMVDPKTYKIIDSYSNGGAINPYMYYSGGPIQYEVGGKVWQGIGNAAYGVLEGTLNTVTGGLTAPIMNMGQEALQKAANKNFDPTDPDDVKAMRQINTAGGAGEIAGSWLGLTLNPANVGSAVAGTASGANTIVQSSTASDSAKQWSQGLSGIAQFGNMMNGAGATTAAGAGAGATEGASASTSNFKNIMTNFSGTEFGKSAGKAMPFVNQAAGMLGDKQGSLLEQGYAMQKQLNSPEYLAMRDRQNQAYVNQGLSFAANGGPVNNNLVTLQTDSMRNRYKTYKTKYRQGGSMNQSNVDFISDEAGLHQENFYDGVPLTRGKGAYANGGAALVEAGEGVIRDEQGNPSFILPDQGDGEPVYMLKPNASYTDFERDKDGNYIQLPITVADWRKKEENRGSNFRDPKNDYASNPRKDKDNQLAMRATEIQKQLKAEQAQQNQMMVEGALQYAAAGGKLNKDLKKILSNDIQSYVEADNYYAYGGYLPRDKGFNMPNSYAKGGSIHIKESKKGTFTAAAKKRGKSVQEFAKDVLRNKGNYSAAMVKKANFARNAAGWKHAEGGNITPDNPGFNALPEYVQAKIMSNMAMGGPLYGNTDSEYTYAHGGPVVSNVNQGFGLYAQNRGGMMMARGGNFPNVDNDLLLKYENDYDQRMQDLMKFTPDISDLGNDIIDPVDSIQSTIPGYDIQRKNFQDPLNSNIPTPGIVGNVENMPALSEDATYLSSLQKYLANNYPESLNKLNFLEAKDEEENMFEYGTSFKPVTNNQSAASDSTTPWYDEPGYSKAARYSQAIPGVIASITALQNKKRKLTPERISPSRIDLERSRITTKEEGRRALDSGLRTIRGGSGSTGQLAANTKDAILNYNKNMGANIAKSYETEENTNAQLAQQAALANQQVGNQFKTLNEQNFQNAQTQAIAGLQDTTGKLAGAAGEERKQYLQEWIAKNKLKTRDFIQGPDGSYYYEGPDGTLNKV